jgi:hypothetical protein
MTMFCCECVLIEQSGVDATYRFFPDRLHALEAAGVVRINSNDWSYTLIEPSSGEELGAVSSDAGCMYRLIPKIKAKFSELGTWPETARHMS